MLRFYRSTPFVINNKVSGALLWNSAPGTLSFNRDLLQLTQAIHTHILTTKYADLAYTIAEDAGRAVLPKNHLVTLHGDLNVIFVANVQCLSQLYG